MRSDRISWKVIIPIVAALLAAAPATLAEPRAPSGTSSPFKKYSCDQKHSLCIERCRRAGHYGTALNRCMEECAGKWLSCKRLAARTDSDDTTVQPDLPRK